MAENKIKVRRPRRIVFYSPIKKERDRDEEALLLIAQGKTVGYILARTGLSQHQYSYLAKRAGKVRLADARACIKGTLGGDLAIATDKKMREEAEAMVIRHIRRNVAPPQTLSKAHTGPKGENPYPLQEGDVERVA